MLHKSATQSFTSSKATWFTFKIPESQLLIKWRKKWHCLKRKNASLSWTLTTGCGIKTALFSMSLWRICKRTADRMARSLNLGKQFLLTSNKSLDFSFSDLKDTPDFVI